MIAAMRTLAEALRQPGVAVPVPDGWTGQAMKDLIDQSQLDGYSVNRDGGAFFVQCDIFKELAK